MTRDNIVSPWSEYAKEEWERMGIILDPDRPTQRGPHTHRMDAPSDVTTWTVIQTRRNAVTDDGRGMSLRDEWWEVPSFVVDAIDSGRQLDPDPRTADEEPWDAEPRLRIPAEDLCSVSVVGLVMLACAFALGLAVGWVVR